MMIECMTESSIVVSVLLSFTMNLCKKLRTNKVKLQQVMERSELKALRC